MKNEELAAAITSCICPACEETLGNVDVFNFNLMFSTTIGPGSQRVGYLRPELPRGCLSIFPACCGFTGTNFLSGQCRSAKSSRNEISPRQVHDRLRDFTQAEAEIFVHPLEKNHHPSFKRYKDTGCLLLTYIQQQRCEEPLELSMQEAVDKGIIAKRVCFLPITSPDTPASGYHRYQARTSPFRQHLPE